MDLERTQVQSPADRVKAQDLSLRRTQPPAKVPGYEPERLLGEGAYGEVWVATERNTGRKVAVKFYTHRGGLDWSLLKREVEKLAFLSADRYVIQLIEVGWDSDPPYYVMEYLGHGSLEERLAERGSLPIDEAVVLFREVATGLMHAHGKGVLHCDLKPANVLLDQDSRPRLCDFGQARLSDEQTPSLGTLFYMAPEQAHLKQAVPDARWDVYALGALFYCMLTGEPPYRSEQAVKRLEAADTLEERLAAYRQTIENATKPMEHRQAPGVNRFLAEIVDRCLAPRPERRYSNVQSLLHDLEEWQRRKARRPVLVFAIMLPLVLLTAVGYFAYSGFKKAMGVSDSALRERTTELHKLAATYAAPAVAEKIHTRWGALIGEAEELSGAQRETKGKTPLKTMSKAAVQQPPVQTIEARKRKYNEFTAKAKDALLRLSLREGESAAAELKLLVKARDWADQQIRRHYEGDPDAERKIEAERNAVDPVKLLGYAELTEDEAQRPLDKLEIEHRRLVLENWHDLQKWVAALRKHYQEQEGLATSSWFITDDRGNQVARDPLDMDTLFHNYSSRDYFHGGDEAGRAAATGQSPRRPIREPHLSQVYESKATKRPTVAFSVPVQTRLKDDDGGESLVVSGVLAMSVEFGAFSELQNEDANIFTALVDARVDSRRDGAGQRGALLEHPILRELRRGQQSLPPYYLNAELTARAYELTRPAGASLNDEQLRRIEVLDKYQDPVEEPIDGGPDAAAREAYRGPWLAAMKPVVLNRRNTGWVVVVQEKQADALAPVTELRRQLTGQGIVALIVIGLVVCGVWGMAYLTLQSHTRSRFVNAVRRRIGLTGGRSTASATAGGGRTARRQAKTPTSRSAGR